ncbi:hypothetical protein Zmor_001052 [Zophobas morio]|uniref:Uncharacterized protein n=1 Tax=Zophobas morio TaxID=2755281 RepID=A0AA38J4H8_9CUCU|nr:hypothetical protein Zmor_001052 [Zophobas morio]
MGTIESYLKVVNNTNQDIIDTSVSSCDNYDWDENCRPDRNFQHQNIPARGGSVSQRLEVKRNASHCPFNMVLTFADSTVDKFRIHQKHVFGCCAGFNHMQRAHDITFSVSNENQPTLIIQIANTNQQVQNEEAEKKNREGEVALETKDYETAIKKFNEALNLNSQDSVSNKIKSNKSQAFNQWGEELLQKIGDLEADITDDKSQEIQDTLNEALKLFQNAEALSNSPKYQHNLTLVNLKIEGNRIFNEANEMEKEAFVIFDNGGGDIVAARNNYKDALVKFQEALKKFEDGLQLDRDKFEDCVNIARAHIEEVNQMIDDIERIGLNDRTSGQGNIEKDEIKTESEDRIDPRLI